MKLLELTLPSVLCYQFVQVLGSSSSTMMDTTETTTVARQQDDDSDDDISGLGDGLRVTIIIFIVLLIVSLTVSLTFGIYKRYKYQRKHGLYKKKARVYLESEDKRDTPDLDIFTVLHTRREESPTSSTSHDTTENLTTVHAGHPPDHVDTSTAVHVEPPPDHVDTSTAMHVEQPPETMDMATVVYVGST